MNPLKQERLKELLDQVLDKMGLEPVNSITGDYSLEDGIRIDTIPQPYGGDLQRIIIYVADGPPDTPLEKSEYKNLDIKNESSLIVTKHKLRTTIREVLDQHHSTFQRLAKEARHLKV